MKIYNYLELKKLIKKVINLLQNQTQVLIKAYDFYGNKVLMN